MNLCVKIDIQIPYFSFHFFFFFHFDNILRLIYFTILQFLFANKFGQNETEKESESYQNQHRHFTAFLISLFAFYVIQLKQHQISIIIKKYMKMPKKKQKMTKKNLEKKVVKAKILADRQISILWLKNKANKKKKTTCCVSI